MLIILEVIHKLRRQVDTTMTFSTCLFKNLTLTKIYIFGLSTHLFLSTQFVNDRSDYNVEYSNGVEGAVGNTLEGR